MSLNFFWDATKKGFNITLLENNLRAVCSTSSNSSAGVFANTGRNEGKWYWEIHFKKTTNGDESIGIANDSTPFNHNSSNGSPPNFAGINTYHSIITNLISSQSNISISGIDLNSGMELTYGFALDLDSNLLEVYINGESKGIVNNIRNNNESYIYPYYLGHRFNDTTVGGAYANFGATPFIYPVPEGFLPYNFSVTNKSLILHDGEYKKLMPSVKGKDAKINVVPQMTSHTAPSGEVTARGAYNPAWQAFDRNDVTYWYDNSSSASNPSWIQYRFTEPKLINKILIQSASISGSSHGLKEFTLWGSNDGSNFTEIFSELNHPNSTAKETYTFSNDTEYLYYKFIFGTSHHSYYTLVNTIEMYEKGTSNTPSYWDSVSSTIPTTQQFLDSGMDSLSPLLDRRVETLEPLPMTDKSEILIGNETGKVFSKTLDLKKYIDIRNMKVEVK